jgi:uncharacterized protein GlcG (DUF336 family)
VNLYPSFKNQEIINMIKPSTPKKTKTNTLFNKAIASLFILIVPMQLQAETPSVNAMALSYGQNISHQCSSIIMEATSKYAKNKNWAVTIAIADTAGQVIMLSRLDNAHRASPDFALEKASSAALTKRSTKIFSDALAKGRTAILGFTDLHVHVAEGGEVLLHNNQIIGSIGVAGVTQKQDREIALVGVNVAKKCQKIN